MLIPTEDDLNRAMATAIGWKNSTDETIYSAGGGLIKRGFWVSPDRKVVVCSYPHYCSDRNLLPEILGAISCEPIWSFTALLEKQCRSKHPMWFAFELPMREIVVAALKALEKWPTEWEGGA